VTLARLGRRAEARAHLGLAAGPSDPGPQTHYMLGLASMLLGEYPQARLHLELSLRQDPSLAPARKALAALKASGR
jgi:hypothetical protein